MVEDIMDFMRSVDWSGYNISVFQVLLLVFALIKRFTLLSLLILGIVLGRGFIEVEQNTNFDGSVAEMVPFLVYTVCALVFFLFALFRLFTQQR